MRICYLFTPVLTAFVPIKAEEGVIQPEGDAGLKGQLKIEAVDYQQTLAEKLHATSMADIGEAPMVKTYGSLKGISREDLAELKATLLASSRHLKPNPQSRHQV